MSVSLPWEDDALSDAHTENLPDDITAATTETAASAPGRQLSVAEIAALGLPIDDPFWVLPEVFDAYLAGDSASFEAADWTRVGLDASATQPIRRAVAQRAPLPSLDPRKRGPASEDLPETVRRAVALIATPKTPHDQLRGAAAHLLEWYRVAYERRPAIGDMVLWWWKAARREVDIRAAWAEEMRALWKTDERPDALDPATASVNAFYGHLAHHAACAFVSAKGHKPDDEAGRELLRGAGFPPPDRPKGKRQKRIMSGPDNGR
jgi:hypothetical protein